MTRHLDLGCGSSKAPGFIGSDLIISTRPDIVHDLNAPPYPFADDSFDEVLMDNVLEHLDDVVATLTEVHRICAPSALVRILVPYFRSRWAAIDPTHVHQFTVESMAYFDESHPFFDRYQYTSARFYLESVTFNEGWPTKRWRSGLVRWANSHPASYEARLSTFLPLDELTFRLRVVK